MKQKSVFSVMSGPCLLALLSAIAVACPQWNRPKCPSPGIHSCVNDQPHFCSPLAELTPSGDEPCAAQGRVCAVGNDGIASCVRIPAVVLELPDASVDVEVSNGDQ